MSIERDLNDRNNQTYELTKSIINKYSDLFDEIFADISGGNMDVKWVNIDFHPSNDIMVNIVGIANYNAGEIITNDFDEVIFIDENNKENYAKPVRMILPTPLIEGGDVEKLLTFVEEYTQIIMASSHEEAELMIADDEFIKKNFSFFKENKSNVKKKKKIKEEYDGFNLSDLDLDELQLQQLKLLKPEGQS